MYNFIYGLNYFDTSSYLCAEAYLMAHLIFIIRHGCPNQGEKILRPSSSIDLLILTYQDYRTNLKKFPLTQALR